MDIIKELGDATRYTLHSHTQYCDGRSTMEEFARAAARSGFTHYGFTPHSPIPFESTCNMKADDVPAYLAEAGRLQQMFPQVRFFKGMEIDYIGKDWNAMTPYFRSLPLDYTISSVHFIPTQDGEMVDIDGRYERFRQNVDDKFHGDIRYIVETFFAQSLQMAETGGFDIIGHFDKIKHNGGLFLPGLEKTPWYNDCVEALIESIIRHRYIVEINTKAWETHQQLFPAQRHWRRLLKAGIPLVVNSDAHYPDKIDASRQHVMRALAYLKQVE